MNYLQPQLKAKALIISGERILCQIKSVNGVRYLSLPGGTQEMGETLEATLLRECDEEIGASVTIDELSFICPHRKSFSTPDRQGREKLEFVFACQLPEHYMPRNGPFPDAQQVDVAWIKIDDLSNQPCLPPQLPDALAGWLGGVSQTYWPERQTTGTCKGGKRQYKKQLAAHDLMLMRA